MLCVIASFLAPQPASSMPEQKRVRVKPAWSLSAERPALASRDCEMELSRGNGLLSRVRYHRSRIRGRIRIPAEEIIRQVVVRLRSEASGSSDPSMIGQSASKSPPAVPPQPPAPFLLPRSGGQSFGGGWTPPNPDDVERDRLVGERGEELIYRQELSRLRDSGDPDAEEHVVWFSRIARSRSRHKCSSPRR